MYRYKAWVKRVVDGDTVDCEVDLGFNIKTHIRFRLAGIDTPEIRGVEKEEGLKSKAYLISLIKNTDSIIVESHKTGKFGRWLGTLYIDELNVNEDLVKNGYAKPYK